MTFREWPRRSGAGKRHKLDHAKYVPAPAGIAGSVRSGQAEQDFRVAGGDLRAVRGAGDGVEELPDLRRTGLVERVVGREQQVVGAGEVEGVPQTALLQHSAAG